MARAWRRAARVRCDALTRALAIGTVWLCAALTGWPNAANAANAAGNAGLASLPAVMPAMSCPSVAALELSGVTDGTVTITSAVLLPAGTVVGNNTLPAPVCDVKGTIGPGASLFELQLPTQGWTQRYLQTGCGGLCGNLSVNAPMASTCVPVTNGTIGFVLPFLRYLDYYNASYPSATVGDLKFTLDGFAKTVPVSNYLAATDPDLSRFAGRGGKLLLWHGLEDQHISPRSSIEYYEAMKHYMGDARVDRFARFYLFPGVAHCGGGQGPNVFDILSPLMAWTETGATPGRIVASIVDANGNTTRMRPVFPYPATARYTGTGSTDDAANFVADTPKADPFVDLHWAGEWLYSPGYEAQCQVQGSQLVCKGGNGWHAYRP
nr:tannase/feruloyl esterase family alpha/beta hydrolase [Burkholderia ubonensis]